MQKHFKRKKEEIPGKSESVKQAAFGRRNRKAKDEHVSGSVLGTSHF